MKDKIKELSDKAKKSVPHGLTPDKWIEVYNEKFAELIVKECARLIDTREPRDQPAPHIYLLKAFGVEE